MFKKKENEAAEPISKPAIEKAEIEKIMKIEGTTRSVDFQTDAKYILKVVGEAGLRAVEDELKKAGYSIDYNHVGANDWFPVGLRFLALLIYKKLFNWDDSKIEELGRYAPKFSPITKLMLRYFGSAKILQKMVPSYWRKHHTTGNLSMPEFEEKKYAILELTDFVSHPAYCRFLKGYFAGVAEMVKGKESNPVTEETKCVHKGDNHHEFIVRWGGE